MAPLPHLLPFSLTHSSTCASASLLTPSGSLCLLHPLPATLSHPTQIPSWLTLSPPPHFCSNATSSEKPSLTTLSQTTLASHSVHLASLGNLTTFYLHLTLGMLHAFGYIPVDGPLPCLPSLKAGITPGFAPSKLRNL